MRHSVQKALLTSITLALSVALAGEIGHSQEQDQSIRSKIAAHTNRIDELRAQAKGLGDSIAASYAQKENATGYSGGGLAATIVRLESTLSEIRDEIKKHSDARAKLEKELDAILNPETETAPKENGPRPIPRPLPVPSSVHREDRDPITRSQTAQRLIKRIAENDLKSLSPEGRAKRVELSKLSEELASLKSKRIKLTHEILKRKNSLFDQESYANSRDDLHSLEIVLKELDSRIVNNVRSQSFITGELTGKELETILTPIELEAKFLAELKGSAKALGVQMATLMEKQNGAATANEATVREMLVTLLALEYIPEKVGAFASWFHQDLAKIDEVDAVASTLIRICGSAAAGLGAAYCMGDTIQSTIMGFGVTGSILALDFGVVCPWANNSGRRNNEREFLKAISKELKSRNILALTTQSQFDALVEHVGKLHCEAALTESTRFDPIAPVSNFESDQFERSAIAPIPSSKLKP